MNEEKQPTEAPATKPAPLVASIERMTACLQDVIANAKAALDKLQSMPSDGMKWMTLSKAVFDVHERSRLGWQKIVEEHGAAASHTTDYFTPKAAIDFVMANPPLSARAEGADRQQVWRNIPAESVGMIRDGGTIHGWTVREGAMIEVLAKQIYVEGKPTDCWTVTGTVDCEKLLVGSLFCGRNKANQLVRFIRNGLVACRLRLRHKRLNRQAKAAAKEDS